jgi:adenine phosphoribosyltransferase
MSARVITDDDIRAHVREIADHPKPGVSFKDITPALAQPHVFSAMLDSIAAPFAAAAVDKVVGIEARGFVFAAPIADRHGAGFVPVRKPGKLPFTTGRAEYDLEYGTDALEIHTDAIHPGERVMIVDDVLATGGTAAAACRLVEQLGAEIVGLTFLIELTFLDGRSRLADRPIHTVLQY